MSFNQLVKNNNGLSLRFLKDNLIKNRSSYSNAYTLREQSLKEFELKNIELYEELLEKRLESASRLKEVNINDLNNIENYIEMLYQKSFSYEKELTKNLSNRINHIESKKIELQGKVSQLLQKLNHLSGFTESYKFVFKEDFYNLINISKQLITKSLLEIDVESNVATLPAVRKEKNAVKNIIISNDSNGIPGSYKTGKSKMVYAIVDGDPNTSFEFFKINTGPIKLVLNVRFEKKIINNQIKIKRAFNSGSTSLKIEDIFFNKKNSRSIKRFIDTNQQTMDIKPSMNGELTLTHLPVECDSISIVFISDEYTTTSKGLKVFNIGLEKLEFYLIEYAQEGEFNSTRIVTPENLFNLSSETIIFPEKSISYDESISVSLNNGAERNLLNYFDNKTKDLLIPSKQNFFNFIYSLKRNDEIISSSEGISNENYFLNSTSLLKSVNKKISPINYSISDNSCNESLRVVQGEIFKRSSEREKAIDLGRVSSEGENKIIIPFSLKTYRIDEEDLVILGNNYVLEKVDSIESISNEKEFYLNYEENSITIILNTSKSVKVGMLLNPLSAKIIYKNEGYYIEIDEPFEYDKRLIKIKTSVKDNTLYEALIPKSSKRFFLPEENIAEESVVVEKEGESSWEVVSPSDNIFEVKSYKAGIIKIKNNEEQLRIRYSKENVTELKAEDFEIWGKNKNVKGIFLYPENVSFNDSSKTIDSQKRSISLEEGNIIEGTLKFSSGPFNTAYKEVEYIDGYTEFLNIKKMQKDFVPKIEWSLEGSVLFTVEKIPYVERSYAGEGIKCFNRDGQEIDDENILTQVEGNAVVFKLDRPSDDNSQYSNGYYLSYYYLDEELENIFKYSVNYKEGIIYFSEPTEKQSFIDYKYGNVRLEYNLYHEIKDFEFNKKDGIVSVETEEFSEANNKIKFFWHQVENSTSLKGLEKYYSPILYSLKVGMN